MMRILLLPLIITILAWVLKHNADKRNPSDKRSVRSYLDRESAANSVRRQDISALPYIQAPLESFPFDITLNDPKKQSQIDNYKKEILSLADRPMLNLIGISNTQLKESYGPANLDALASYDQNYSQYMRNLFLYAQTIYDEHPAQAVQLLEYCIQEGTDISGVYALLGRYYKKCGNNAAFEHLYDVIPDTDSISGKMIHNKLDQLQ